MKVYLYYKQEVVLVIKREIYLSRILKWVDRPMIKVITGVRRCGKSSLLEMIMENVKEKGNVVYVNLEIYDYYEERQAKKLYEYIKKHSESTRKNYIFVDEIQKCKGWEEVVASLLAEKNYDVYITGSNASMLSSDLATNIAGRYIEFKVYPLNFKEFLMFSNHLRPSKITHKDLFDEYLYFGGFPGLFSIVDDDKSKKQYLRSIRDSVVLRDTVQRQDIRDVDLLERIMAYSFDNIGQTFSALSVSNYLKSIQIKGSVPTVASHLNALSDAMLLEKSRRYDIKGKKIMKRMEKYFICDLGIRHVEINYRAEDIGQLLENVVYNELLVRGYEVFVGKEGTREIDFIAEKDGQKKYIQVTYLLASEEAIEREYKPLLMVKDAYPKYVLSMDELAIRNRDGVFHMNIIDFLLSDEM